MFDRILFPTDGSEGANAVLEHVLDIAETHDATLHILNVADTTHDSVTQLGGETIDVLEREGERIVSGVADRAQERRVSTVTEVLQGGVPNTITEYGEKYDIDLIVMPTHGRTGVERILLGSVTEKVVRQAPVPVLTFHPDDNPENYYPYQNILVPTDGSDCANAALDLGTDIVNTYGATLHLLNVVDLQSLGYDIHSEMEVEVLEDHANEVIEEATQLAEEASVESVVGAIEYGSSVPQEIQSYIDEHEIGLVVMGTHGRTGVDRLLLGSVAEKVVRIAPVPVLTVPGPPSEG